MKITKSIKKFCACVLAVAMVVASMAGYQAQTANAAEDWGITKVVWKAAGDTGNMQCDVSYDYKAGYTNFSLYLGEVADDNLARNYGADWVWAKGASNNGFYDGVYNRQVDGSKATPYWNVGDTVTFILVAFDGALNEVDRDTIEVVVGEDFTKAVTSLKVTASAQTYNETHGTYYVPISTPDVEGAASYTFYVGEVSEENIAKAPDGFAFNQTNQHSNIPVVVPLGTSTIYGVAYDAAGEVLLEGSTTVTLVESMDVPAGDGYSYLTATSASIVSAQQPGFAAERGIYMTVAAGISEISVNGVTGDTVGAIQGAGTVIYLSALTKAENKVVITHGAGTSTVTIMNANGTTGEEESTTPGEEESSEDGEEPTEEPTSAPSGGDGSEYAGLTYTQVGTSKYYVAASNDGFPFQLLEDQGTQMLIIPGVASGTEPIWPDFTNVTLNGNAFDQAPGAGIYIQYSMLNDNAYNVFQATSAVDGHTFQIIIKAGTPAGGEEESSSAGGEEPTEEPTSAPSGTEWKVLEGGTGYSYDTDTVENVVNIQTPGFATAAGVYMHGNGGISAVTINGVAASDGVECEIDGAGVLIYLTALTKNINEIVIEHAVGTATVRIKNDNVAADEGVKIDAGVNVLGWQVSCGSLTANGTTYDGGIRTVYAIDDTVDGKSTAGATVGLVYGLAGSATEDDMVVGSTSDYVTSTVATANGVIDGNYNQNADSTLYAVIMAANLSKATAASVQKEYMVRAYVEIDGTYYYSDVATYSVYSVAKVLYDSASMQTATGHAYVYNILTKVDDAYPEVAFGSAGNTVVKPE